jgi:hypothetical protein
VNYHREFLLNYRPGDILTALVLSALEKSGISLATYGSWNDQPELAAGFLLWLATQGDKVDFLRGRYVAANWVRDGRNETEMQ